jgi:hypothetical protein
LERTIEVSEARLCRHKIVTLPSMSGLYYLVVFAFWGAVGFVVSIASAILLVRSARRRQKDAWTVAVCGVAPFIGLLWIAFTLFLHIRISNNLAHQDFGMSGDPYVTLPNGYRLESGNTYDNRLVAPGSQSDIPIAGPGYVRSIIHLQIDGDDFVGDQYDFTTRSIRPFRFNMKTGRFSAPGPTPTADETLHAKIDDAGDIWGNAQTQARTDSNGFWNLYAKYRQHWPAYLLITLVVLGEGGLIVGVRKLLDAN